MLHFTLNRQAELHVSRHMRSNPAVRRARLSVAHRVLRRLLTRRFWLLLLLYLLVDLAAVAVEALVGRGLVPTLIRIPRDEATLVVASAPGVLITAQTGALAVITLALALVTLVAQRDEASGDIQIYYHHSMAFEIAASCLASAAIVSMQSVWPLQVVAHALLLSPENVATKFGLTLLHVAWLALNLGAVAHFVVVTLQFVQRPSRERMRRQYVVRELLAADVRRRLREPLFAAALEGMLPDTGARRTDRATVGTLPFFGRDRGERDVVRSLREPARLEDVWLPPLRWAVRSWARRSSSAAAVPDPPRRSEPDRPALRLPIGLDEVAHGEAVLCLRRGGVPMNWWERLLIRTAMRFSAVRDD